MAAALLQPHHQRIARVLQWLNAPLLSEMGVVFGGGTALTFLLGEYRRSDAIDLIINHLSPGQDRIALLNARHGPAFLIDGPAPDGIEIGPFRAHRDKYAGSFIVDNIPIRFEIIYESRVTIPAGERHPGIPICHAPLPTLAEMKWHALLDRGFDNGVHRRDLYDLAMLARHGVDIVKALRCAATTLPSVPIVCRQIMESADAYAVRRADYRFLDIPDEQAPALYEGLCLVAKALGLPPALPYPFEIAAGKPDTECRLPPSDL
ncbi:nucleotidyl transferase AbiEii/AbiGii toxin family protein [Isoalcanivorax pacificus]|uniref:nucleotidyl transferase AbiEii/AbiGii toxin family protein n=1 Tax=Isoalcanivorax pacificus TaxID=1306787 RepID=UPI00030BA97C|nr:nucleotidyl transferase AbiEii/AbiGii toxin family protein [Isoalcanivorax pacificus]